MGKKLCVECEIRPVLKGKRCLECDYFQRVPLLGDSAELLDEWSHDINPRIRRDVAWHANTAPQTLVRLAGDEDKWVVWSVLRHPKTPEEVFDEQAASSRSIARQLVAESPRCPVEALRDLADDPDAAIRAAVAGNPHCPAGVLRELAKDAEGPVRQIVAANSRCPRKVLGRLVLDDDPQVRQSAADNPRCPGEL